ncbi:ankyrin repeat domain-containing protein [bacterium]|nr:MAG: ankyrin repeat domain-containing protein [bacterium]
MQIHTDAARGDTVAVLHHLDSGIPVDVLDEKGQTPLIVAVSSRRSNLETVQLLLNRGANPNAISISEESSIPVLIEAIIFEKLNYIECLLDAGADINLDTEDYADALTVSITGTSSDLSVMEFLIERGAVVQWDDEGKSALTRALDDGNFNAVRRLCEAGADESRLEWTPLTRAIVIGSLEDVRTQLQQGDSISERDEWKRTPWLISLAVGDIDKAKLLLEASANRDDVGHCGKTALMYAIEANHPEMLRWLLEIGCDPDATNDFEETALMEAASYESALCVRLLLDAGADPNNVNNRSEKAIANAYSPEVIRLLVEVGQDLNDLSFSARAALLGFEDDGEPYCTREEFEEGRTPRFGTANPEKMDVPFWDEMVRSGAPAYRPRALFLPEILDEEGPVWCYHRFGKSINQLPDGRFIEIGGEHEDWYDSDFYIYNDVFVHYPDGSFDIYGYPAEVFPQTDFHSATLVGDFIYIIGNTSYPEQRVVGYTPVYRLNINTLAIEKVETTGDNPGWIFRHKAALIGDEIHISGGDVWNGPMSPEEAAAFQAARAK